MIRHIVLWLMKISKVEVGYYKDNKFIMRFIIKDY